ncbi:MAG: hypothetical protein ACQESC_04725 [Nanobdellota archaeon]
MKTITLFFGLMVLTLLSLSGCGSVSQENSSTDDSSRSIDSTGEELLDVRAEYSFCYDTGSYDPTKRFKCELPLTYLECQEWMSKEQGSMSTTFYANFTGGEPTISGRTANRYYMVVEYGDGLNTTTDPTTVFKDIPEELYVIVDGACYPNATIKIFDMSDELKDSMSLDYSS